MNVFRHWFLWGSIEVKPGVFDWSGYDRQMELAGRHGLGVIIAEMITSVPEWLFRAHPECLYRTAEGWVAASHMGASSATGGFSHGSAGAVCLDTEGGRDLAGRFLTQLVLRYRDHPSLLGYDVWNECNYAADICHCQATQAAFRAWLEARYGSLEALADAWHRYSYASWDDVSAPASLGPYPECMDWLQFRSENFHSQMQWRIDLIRRLDSRSWITAHGIAGSISNMASGGSDDWMAASRVEVYGFTWVASRKGSEPWKQWHAVDLVRAASRGRPFWHAETQGGPLWLQPQVVGRPAADGRVTEPEDIRLWNLVSFAGGARGILFPRWRPLLGGPLFGAFGPYAMDGSRTERSRMASAMARWANSPQNADLFEAVPVRGDLGIVVVPETQLFSHLLLKESGWPLYSEALWGAYRGFFDNAVQADWVHIDHIADYGLLYLPYPIMLSEASSRSLKAWVAAGGTLLCEGCPAYFGDGGEVSAVQPGYGLDEALGAREDTVEFMPDLGDAIRFEWRDRPARGALFRQSYLQTGGEVTGRYQDGSAACIEHGYGRGRTLLLGTHPSAAYYRTSAPENRTLFAQLLDWAGAEPRLRSSNPLVATRLHHGPGGWFLWAINPERRDERVEIHFSGELGSAVPGETLWGAAPRAGAAGSWLMALPPRDGTIARLSL